jgi:hypothetical protein
MKIVEKGRIYNSVTGKYYSVYGRESEPGDEPIRGLWKHFEKLKEGQKKKTSRGSKKK